jgi:Uma2 family endonuclease
MAAIPASPENRFLMRNIGWRQYRAIADAVGETHVRLTYDRGRLEFMTLSHGHERRKELLGRLLGVLTEELDIPCQSGGSTTFNREDLERGIEPDQCYYLENEPRVRDKEEIDLNVDPPPDLAIEIEVSRGALDRMSIYAAMRVPEVWRFDGTRIHIHVLSDQGDYIEVERSRHFPFLPIAEVEAFMNRRTEMDETQLVKLFRQWVREHIARGWKLAGPEKNP